MPTFILKQQALKAGKSEFSQHTAREVTAAAHEDKSKHRSRTLQAALQIPTLI